MPASLDPPCSPISAASRRMPDHPDARMSDDAGLLEKRGCQKKCIPSARSTSLFGRPETVRAYCEAPCRQPTVFTVTSDASSAATQYLRLNVMALGLDTQAFVKSPSLRQADQHLRSPLGHRSAHKQIFINGTKGQLSPTPSDPRARCRGLLDGVARRPMRHLGTRKG